MIRTKIILFLLAGFTSLHAEYHPFIGMRNSYYGFVGIRLDDKWGATVEQSLYPQGPEKQHIRGWIFSKYSPAKLIDIRYAAFIGTAYNESFFDAGVRADLIANILEKHLQLLGTFQPFYDSFWEKQLGYRCAIQSMFTNELGAFFSFKNLADYRNLEKRYSAGMLFQVKNLYVRPEYSIPLNRDHRAGRTTIFFEYSK